MVDKKRKNRESKKYHGKQSSEAAGMNGRRKWKGPRLPNSMKKALETLNPVESEGEERGGRIGSDEDEEIYGNDIYEYEGKVAQEDSRKNRRFDPVENLEYQLPEDFEDEVIPSDDEDISNDEKVGRYSDESGEDSEEEDDAKHARLLEGITGLPKEAFEGKKKRKGTMASEVDPKSEHDATNNVLDGDGQITIQDLLDPLQGKAGYNQLKKRMHQLESKSAPILAPLPKPERDLVERKVAYGLSKKEMGKWEPVVKRNREAPTLFFDENIDLKYSTVGAIASEFEPRTEFEKKIASLVHDPKVMEAHKKDGARLLELNELTVEEEKERRDRISKMRSLLFRHELKQKHIKKIKSKTYHRLLKKDRLKAFTALMDMDPEAAQELARKQEFKRAEERLTLKHKNSSKWAKRILKRGLNAQDDGTRAAIAEQLQQHALLTRKQNSMKDNSSSDESTDDEDLDNSGSDQDAAKQLLAKATDKTLKVLEEEDDVPTSGVLSLPFMIRGLKKRKEAAIEEAQLALEEYGQMESSHEAGKSNASGSSGRMVFGAVKPQNQNKKVQPEINHDCDSEGDIEADLEVNEDDGTRKQNEALQIDIENGFVAFEEDSQIHQKSIFKGFDDTVKDPGAKTTYEVSIFASDSWRKMKDEEEGPQVKSNSKAKQKVSEPTASEKSLQSMEANELAEESDTDSEGQMVDGILSAGPTRSYELPSQEELVRQAFAGDDVEEDFEKEKLEVLNKENPEPEKPVLLPGWGQWTNIQKKRGTPSWMLKEHDDAKRKREEALKKRKDAALKHVVISEKVDKKAEKLHTKSLPFPYTSKEVFEQSIRMPIGPDYNPVTALGALTRSEVVKKSGIIIKPIQFKEVNPHEKGEDYRGSEKKGGNNKRKRGGDKAGKKKAIKT